MGKRKSSNRNQLVCPVCGSADYKNLGPKSTTRCCNRKVVRVNGRVYASLEAAPEWRIIQAFVEKKRTRPEMSKYDIPYGTSPYREAVTAAGILYEKCGDSIELALEIVRVSFDHPAHSWREHAGMFALSSNRYLPEVKAIAEHNLEQERGQERRQALRSRELTDDKWETAYAEARQAI